MNDTKICTRRFASQVEDALWYFEQGLMDEAEICAYEAGCYSGMNINLEMPAPIAKNVFLKEHFTRGALEAPQDAEDQVRAEAIADAGFDPWYPTGSTP